MTPIARSLTAAAACMAVSFALGSPAFAHNEFDPAEAAPGTIIDLTLVVENESTTAGIIGVEIRFPAPLTLVALPPADGWQAQPVDGSVGSPSIGIKWTRPSGPRREDPRLPFTVGPLPDTAGQLQFKVVQTYDDGRIDRWIEEWPEGAPEPKNPGPVLRLVAGAAGTVPTTTASSAATSTRPTPAPGESTAPHRPPRPHRRRPPRCRQVRRWRRHRWTRRPRHQPARTPGPTGLRSWSARPSPLLPRQSRSLSSCGAGQPPDGPGSRARITWRTLQRSITTAVALNAM